jgi:hypothetical protein
VGDGGRRTGNVNDDERRVRRHDATRKPSRFDVAARRRLGLWLLRRVVKLVVRLLHLDRFDLFAELCSEASADEARCWNDHHNPRGAS